MWLLCLKCNGEIAITILFPLKVIRFSVCLEL